jgi:hypothetical protein
MRRLGRTVIAILFATLLSGGLVTALTAVAPLAPAAQAQAWAPAATATIHPGVNVGPGCTGDFIFSNGSDVFIGEAAHCTTPFGRVGTNDGCTATSLLPIGTAVPVTGASHPGTLAYSSWLTMQSVGETDAKTCNFNDLALIRLDPADVGSVNPSVPVWGGPVALASRGTTVGDRIFADGNSPMLPTTTASPMQGVAVADRGNGWAHDAYFARPAIPGDSGSAMLDGTGHALAVLQTVEFAVFDATGATPVAEAGTDTGGDLPLELGYLAAHGPAPVSGATVVPGTEPFNPAAVPVG